MALHDSLGLELSGASLTALDRYDTALRGLQRFVGDPVGELDRVLAERPDFVMAHVLKGYLYGLSTEAAASEVAASCWRAGSALPATERERRHLAALGELAAGNWHGAGALLEDLAI